jgi:hypothetical protein
MEPKSVAVGLAIIIFVFGILGIFYKKFMGKFEHEQSLQHQSKDADTVDSSDEDTVL